MVRFGRQTDPKTCGTRDSSSANFNFIGAFDFADLPYKHDPLFIELFAKAPKKAQTMLFKINCSLSCAALLKIGVRCSPGPPSFYIPYSIHSIFI